MLRSKDLRVEESEERGRKVIGVSLPAGAYGKLQILGEQLGLTDAGTARHLIMMALQQLMGQIQQVEQGRLLSQMADAVSSEMKLVEEGPVRLKSSGGASNTATTGQICPQPSRGAKRRAL
jgi:hypothetical protein